MCGAMHLNRKKYPVFFFCFVGSLHFNCLLSPYNTITMSSPPFFLPVFVFLEQHNYSHLHRVPLVVALFFPLLVCVLPLLWLPADLVLFFLFSYLHWSIQFLTAVFFFLFFLLVLVLFVFFIVFVFRVSFVIARVLFFFFIYWNLAFFKAACFSDERSKQKYAVCCCWY